METKFKKKIGLLAFASPSGGGTYQYTQSVIDALKNDKSDKYVIFCRPDDNRFDKLGLEVRKINKPKSNLIIKINDGYETRNFFPFYLLPIGQMGTHF